MKTIPYRTIILGDMSAHYILDQETGVMELRILPSYVTEESAPCVRKNLDSFIQVYLDGDQRPSGYAGGISMRQNGTVQLLRLQRQTVQTRRNGTVVVCTEMRHPSGCAFMNYVQWDGKHPVLSTWTEVENQGNKDMSLEMISSFSLGGVTGVKPGHLRLHRLQSAWSMEGRLRTEFLEEMNLEQSWARYGVRCERFGQVGSLPVNHWFPWMVLEDTERQIFWGCQLAHHASWQMEIYRQDDVVALSGGLADYEFGHWKKTLTPGEKFTTPLAFLTVCHANRIVNVSHRLLTAMEGTLSKRPLPLLFNEYCTTWGHPSQAKIQQMLPLLQQRNFTHFVIDAGWYKPENKDWDKALGDYYVSRELFPDGIKTVANAIRESGMVPGIWFEPETVGETSEAYWQEAHLLKRNGVVITTQARRFRDMRDPWVQQILHHKITEFLRENGFGYVKLDYNDTIGIGCDGAESLGEGLRQNMEAAYMLLKMLKLAMPHLEIEVCASGGHRLEPKTLMAVDYASFSDAHECAAIPIVAANLHLVMQPGQMQVWAVLRKGDSLTRIVYSLTAAMLGCMCISGDITELTQTQWETVDLGIAFYRQASEVIRQGISYRFGPKVLCYNAPEGWQGVLRLGKNGVALLILHQFGGQPLAEIRMPLQSGYKWMIKLVYGNKQSFQIQDNNAVWRPTEVMSGIAVLLLHENI